ncbi:hypothetical protein DPMN_140686 [Dreissena polymorpha]|uniref:Uncharacterized protein n=1 Tax=Dreissena polymorpha TaxID=45954 RepID=A0A9D4G823_DREPO|nr:hypothetical protein DPMN_140686 [Dreissena polymorpha]
MVGPKPHVHMYCSELVCQRFCVHIVGRNNPVIHVQGGFRTRGKSNTHVHGKSFMVRSTSDMHCMRHYSSNPGLIDELDVHRSHDGGLFHVHRGIYFDRKCVKHVSDFGKLEYCCSNMRRMSNAYHKWQHDTFYDNKRLCKRCDILLQIRVHT